MEWGKKVSKKYVSKELSEKIHEKVKPFITWLKEAEEEESDESDEDLELEFDERVHASGIKEKVLRKLLRLFEYPKENMTRKLYSIDHYVRKFFFVLEGRTCQKRKRFCKTSRSYYQRQ